MARNVVCVSVKGIGVIAVPQTMVTKLANQGLMHMEPRGTWRLDDEFADVAMAIPGASILTRER